MKSLMFSLSLFLLTLVCVGASSLLDDDMPDSSILEDDPVTEAILPTATQKSTSFVPQRSLLFLR